MFFVSKKSELFLLIQENKNYKNENIEGKYLNIMRKNQFLKVKNSLLELEKDFRESKDTESNDREIKIKKENYLLNWLL